MRPDNVPYLPLGGYDFPVPQANIAIFGASRSGKNIAVLNPLYNALLPHYYGLVLDGKQNEIELLRDILPESRIANLHPFDADAMAWAVSSDLRAPDAIADAVYTLVPEDERSGPGRFFDSTARNTTGAALGVLTCEAVIKQLNKLGRPWDFRDLLCAFTPDRIRTFLGQTPEGRRAVRTALDNDSKFVDREKDVISTTVSHIDKFKIVFMALHHHSQGRRLFSLNDWAERRTRETCVRFALDEARSHTLHPYVAWQLAYALRRIQARRARADSPNTVIFLNEVQNVVKSLGSISNFLTTALEKGAMTVAASQHFSAINKAANDPNAAQEFLDNASIQVFLRTDAPDVANHASRLFGETEIARVLPSFSSQAGLATNRGENRGLSDGRSREGWNVQTNEGVSEGSSPSIGGTRSLAVQVHRQPTLPYETFLNMQGFSFARGADVAVRMFDKKWATTIHPRWLAERSPVPREIRNRPLDEDLLRFTDWSPEEENAFLGTETQNPFAHIRRPK